MKNSMKFFLLAVILINCISQSYAISSQSKNQQNKDSNNNPQDDLDLLSMELSIDDNEFDFQKKNNDKTEESQVLFEGVKIVGSSAVGAGVAAVGIPAVATGLGFTAAGITAGSTAAGMMSAASGGGAILGAAVPILQSIGVIGLGTFAAPILAGGAVVGGGIYYAYNQFAESEEESECE